MLEEGELHVQVRPRMTADRKVKAVVGTRVEKEDLKPSVFLTGGTGFLGSHLAAAFLKAGREVILLARPKNGKSTDERVSSLFDWLAVKESLRGRLRVVTGEIPRPRIRTGPADHQRPEAEGLRLYPLRFGHFLL